MNKLGGWDSFNFIKNSQRAIDIERKQFKAPLEIGYSKSDRLKQNYNTTITDVININSDWVSDEVSELLEELATSPLIYLERSATNFIAVNIVNNSYDVRKYMTDRKLFNVSFDIEYTYNRYRQTL
jgi:histidinol-phosphate/aromatic aminotransferase/cobyric acid decarboxylase-like protein